MKATAAIFLREIQARKQILWLAVAVAALIICMPLMPGVRGSDTNEVWQFGSMLLSMGLGFAIAIGLGISVFGVEFSAGRAGFHFARPVPVAAVWIGRMAAVYVLVLASELIILVPGVASSLMGGLAPIDPVGFLIFCCVVPALVLLVSHAFSVMFRARTPWLGLDLIGLSATGFVAWTVWNSLTSIDATRAAHFFRSATIPAVIAALAVAGFVSLSKGRTDLRKVHAFLSLTLWSLLVLASGAALVWKDWMTTFGPEVLVDIEIKQLSETAEWVVVNGSAWGRFDVRREFLVSRSGRPSVELPYARCRGRLRFDAKGNVAAWMQGESWRVPLALWWVDLEAGSPKPTETTISFSSRESIVLDPSGRLIAVRGSGLVSVYDLRSERLLWMARLDLGVSDYFHVSFDSPEVVSVRIDRWEAVGRSFEEWLGYDSRTGEILPGHDAGEELGSGIELTSASGEPQRFRTGCKDLPCKVEFAEPRPSGRPQQVALPEWAVYATLLEDGRVIVRDGDLESVRRVAVESQVGSDWISHDVGKDRCERIGGEIVPGSLLCFEGTTGDYGEPRTGAFSLFDIDTGQKHHIVDGSKRDKIQRGMWLDYWGSSRYFRSKALPFFIDNRGALVYWNPETHEFTTLAGGS